MANTYDLIFGIASFCHMDTDKSAEGFLSFASKSLSPGGKILCNVNVEMKESGLCDSQAHHDQCAKEQQIQTQIIESFKEARFGDTLEALNQATPNIGLDWDALRKVYYDHRDHLTFLTGILLYRTPRSTFSRGIRTHFPPETGKLKVQIVRRLLDLGADPNKALDVSPLMNIVSDKYRQPETPTFMRMLLEQGADVNAVHQDSRGDFQLTALHVACRGKYADDVKQLLGRSGCKL
jgi:hypothetical protein